MGLKDAFNSVARLHSRAATLKRLGTPDIYSPIRIMPSNYFRYLDGPAATVIHGREFIIPIDTMLGHQKQLLSFDDEPTEGTFKLIYGAEETDDLAFNAVASVIQADLREIDGLENVTVTGDYTAGFTVTFIGVNGPTLLDWDDGATELDAEITVSIPGYTAWNPRLKRGDKIIDSVYTLLTIDEIIEMVDMGGAIMGYRVRCE